MVFQLAKDIKGSTKIVEIIAGIPDEGGLKLLSKLGWQCAYCAVSATEPLALAAKRHGVSPRRVLDCFRAQFLGTLTDEMVENACVKISHKTDSWENHAHQI